MCFIYDSAGQMYAWHLFYARTLIDSDSLSHLFIKDVFIMNVYLL